MVFTISLRYTTHMDTAQLSPYLNFNGTCEQAMQFYQSVLGGKLELTRFGDFAGHDMPVADDQKDKIMHATLTNGSLTFMASDSRPDQPVVFGDSVSVSLAGQDMAALTAAFNGLSAGGTITMPLHQAVWSDTFGMFTDKFGIHWMINISAGEASS